MKQYNIFGEIEYVDDDGNVRRCEHCGKINPREQSSFCSDECIKESLDNVFGTIKIDKNDRD